VRYSFAGFGLALLLAGTALVMVRRNIFPWPLSPENSVFYGCIFIGAMCYFLYGLVYPYWANARGQLLGFLAYDLVLIGPFLLAFLHGARRNAPEPYSLHRRRRLQRPACDLLPVPASAEAN